ncbi:MAG: hypothetical protein KU28_04190 [Sulfurovum sp. PC08-66]|nr:MAG: hypothetical protein KU28_04190 [Sulfurovum sp. PC08-66]
MIFHFNVPFVSFVRILTYRRLHSSDFEHLRCKLRLRQDIFSLLKATVLLRILEEVKASSPVGYKIMVSSLIQVGF